MMSDSRNTRACYPFNFAFRIRYGLEGNRLNIDFAVDNISEDTMYCAMGGHPGFRVPLEPELCFEDYKVTFSRLCRPLQVRFSDALLITGEETPFLLQNGTDIPLRHDLFSLDAVVLKNSSSTLRICSEKGKHGVEVDYGDFPYIGLWQPNRNEPQFLCVEPWSTLPGREGVVEKLENFPGILSIPAGVSCTKKWSITIW